MEPWDGPASIAFTDGIRIGAVLDRNGLRPSRYWVTDDDFVVMASEVGVLDIPQEKIVKKGRLEPGRMFLIDTEEKRIIRDEEIKEACANMRPYRKWLTQRRVTLPSDLPATEPAPEQASLIERQQIFGCTQEDIDIVMLPMAAEAHEAVGSMGNDAPLAVLSSRPQLLFNYFKQLFAQVTNPPIDSIREEIVMSLETTLGREGNLLDETPGQCGQLRLLSPVITDAQLQYIREIDKPGLKAAVIATLFPAAEGPEGMERALDRICAEVSAAIAGGATILILSDRGVDAANAPIPSLLACGAVHHHLVRQHTRTQCGIVIESGEPREVMHFALLTGYGAGAINPYLAFETIHDMVGRGLLSVDNPLKAVANYITSIEKGLLKVMSKIGISTQQSYRSAQIFEAVGLGPDLIDRCFTGTVSRIGGIDVLDVARETLMRHAIAFSDQMRHRPQIDPGGQYRWRQRGEFHQYNPDTVALLQHATRSGSRAKFAEFSKLVNDRGRTLATLRGLLKFKQGNPIPVEEVEPASAIVKRFCSGAMSFGSISKEAHETLAIAMNRIGGRSNTGEGGEDPLRFQRDANGDLRRSAIKQVASGRFGVTNEYLVNADELQIKMAQGAKPGEGGQLPGFKVFAEIAKARYSTPGVELISPPPHHDIYSIEDLAQLIHDLKNANVNASVSVKLVSEVGVGTVAAGVAKAKADHVVIAGHDGGTGASPISSIKHAGTPWELGLAETQQTLVLNRLRGRIRVQADGQMKTGRDVVIGALLGADEFGFATAPLVVEGCIMMRKCHLNTCPVGVATQDPVLRARFTGQPEHVVNYFFFVAEEVRELMAQLGIRKFDELIGRSDLLDMRKGIDHWKARGLDFSRIFYRQPDVPGVARFNCEVQDHGLKGALDHELITKAVPALERGEKVVIETTIRNRNRTVGTMLSSEVARRKGADGLPADTITVKFTGTAGQSFGAFLARGITLDLTGEANDYVGKGLSGGRLIVRPPAGFRGVPTENIIVGNTVLYGATEGEVFFRGVAGERFCVRNSGAQAVVEGTGDHGCEYMTGGTVAVLGMTGRNFAAGMSGGIAYVYDVDGQFARRCNMSMVALEKVLPESEQATDGTRHRGRSDEAQLKQMIEEHARLTGSERAKEILADWTKARRHFLKVFPHEYRRALKEIAAAQLKEAA
jgi:glutamate synthase (NADPH/NADH) large chain